MHAYAVHNFPWHTLVSGPLLMTQHIDIMHWSNMHLNQHAFEQPDVMEQDDQLAQDVTPFFTGTGA